VTVNAGKEFETATQVVYIIDSATMRGGAGRNFVVHFQLKYKEGVSVKPDVLDASLASVPPPALKLYQKALAAARDGDARKAVKQLEEAIAAYPQFALALSELGFQYLQLNEPDKANDALQRAIKLAPEAFAPHLSYGRLLIQQKKFAEAEAELKHALKINGTSAQAHFHLARALIGQNNFDAAEVELKRAITLSDDGISEAHRFLGAIYNERGDAKRALEELETYLRLAPNTKDAPQIRSIIKQLREQVAKEK
jgi:tetratricopeptide (TPR) repeat protein